MTIKLSELRRLAKAATPGPWTTEKPSKDEDGWALESVVAWTPGRQGVYARAERGSYPAADCDYIAAANPATLLRLLEIAEAARLLRKTKWGHKDWPHQIMDPLPCDVAAAWEGLDKALEGVEP